MADRRRIVTVDQFTGTVTTVKDLEDLIGYYAVRGSFQVKPAARNPVTSRRQRRYGGSVVIDERHDNASIAWKQLVRGTSVTNMVAVLEAELAILESSRRDLYFEWRPDGATSSVYYEVRGPATWTPTYDWGQSTGAQSVYLDIEIPVGPLARGALQQFTFTGAAEPRTVNLTGILGDAPALADVIVDLNDTVNVGVASPFALIAWTQQFTDPTGTDTYMPAGTSRFAPFGVVQAETAYSPSGLAVTSNASYSGGSGLLLSAPGTGTANFFADPRVLTGDDFADKTINVEVWARVELHRALTFVNITLGTEPVITTQAQGQTFTLEHGSVGRGLNLPSAAGSGKVFRFVKLGTLPMPTDPAGHVQQVVFQVTTLGSGSASFGLDYLMFVPAQDRALSPTGKPYGANPTSSSYPFFLAFSNGRKMIRGGDLAGYLGQYTDSRMVRDSGLGGSPIELPPGDVRMLLKLSNLVPDDPTVDATSELTGRTISGAVNVWPRYYLAKGT